jgi:hypothetical protein
MLSAFPNTIELAVMILAISAPEKALIPAPVIVTI